jgi:CO/xanthine dehydrogenase Mo-binding subunit
VAAEQEVELVAHARERRILEGRRFEAEYFKPYLAHASIGPSCALARWDGSRLEVWTHSQGIHNLRDDLVLALAHETNAPAKDHIVIHHVEGAG